MTTERDIRNQIAYSREEGLAEGLEKGRAEERYLIAQKLKDKGFSDDEVASILG